MRSSIVAAMALVPAAALGQSSRVAAPPAPDLPAASAVRATALPAIAPWLRLSGELRARAEGYRGGGFVRANEDAYVLTRVLIGARIQAARGLSLFAQGMDARAPGKNALPAGAPFRDHADLRQAWVQIGSDSGDWARAGRLELAFGDGRLVGSLPWANTARTFDGARAALVGRGYRVDLFGASVVKVDQDRFDRNVPGSTFYGAYSTFGKVLRGGTFEPFLFWRRQSGLRTELGDPGTLGFATLGAHAAAKLPSRLDYDVQLAVQRGKLADETVAAWAGHWLLGYTVAPGARAPRLFAEYNEASGDRNPSDDRRGTFDQLYPTGHDKYGLTDLVGWQNMRHTRGGVDVRLARGWVVSARYSGYWLADAHDALYNGAGAALARSATGSAGTYVGREGDVVAAGKLLTLSLSAGVGHFVPGTFLERTTSGAPYTYVYAMTTYAF